MSYNRIFLCLIFCLFMCSIQNAGAQDQYSFKRINGKVVDAATGQPMLGVRIQAYEQARYTTLSDTAGYFDIEVPAGCSALTVTASGYNHLNIAIQGRALPLLVSLYENVFQSDYDDVSRFINVSSLKNLEHNRSISIDDEIELKSSLRSIHRSGTPGMGAAMFINGFHSLHNSSMPLIVIDGQIVDNQDIRTPLHDGYYNNVLSAIDVNDIEKVTILNNGTALYGAKGGNGVILIETKRAQDMVTRIDVNVAYALDMPADNLPMMNASNFRLYASDLLGRSFGSTEQFLFLDDDERKLTYKKYHNDTDWSRFIYRSGLSQKYGISVRGGDEVAMYNLSLGYTDSESILEANDFSRLNIRFNTDVNLVKDLYIRLNVAYSNTKRQLFDDGAPEDYTSGTILSTGFLSMIKAPILWPYKYDLFGNATTLLEDADDYGIILGNNNSFSNPLAITQYGAAINKNYQQYDLFSMALAPKYQINRNLSVQSNIAFFFTDETEKYFSPMTGTTSFYLEGKGTTYNQAKSQFIRGKNISIDTHLDWNKNNLVHKYLLKAGVRYLDNGYKSNTISGYNTGNDKMPNITGSLQFREVSGEDDSWRNLAYYASGQWSVADKYYLQATGCLESSSRFGQDGDKGIGLFGVRWGIFPSLQAGWIISSEPFMKDLSFINQLKWTAGIDYSGNDNMDNYASHPYFQSVKFLGNATGIQLANIGNSSISWEETRRIHTGLDFIVLNNRLHLNVDLYDDYIDNLLTLKYLKLISGQEKYWSNDGAMRNRGVDFSLYAKLINRRLLKWDFGFSVNHYKNRIEKLPDNRPFVTTLYGADILTEVHQPAGLFYGYRTEGVFSTTTQALGSGLKQRSFSTGIEEPFQAGDMIFVDKNKDYLIDNSDCFVIGDPNPLLYGNLQTRLTYRRWSLQANFKYSYGNDIYNYLRRQLESGSMIFNQTVALQRRWVAEGQVTDIPRVAYGDPSGNSRFSDRWIEDGSYLKLKRLTLSFDLPLNREFIQGINLYASVENLFTLTSYLGRDPENSMNNNVLYQGIDRGLSVCGKGFVFGTKIRL